jgi:YVTN family beta-propeller protein
MARAILSVAGLGCLAFAVVGGAADDSPAKQAQPVPAASSTAPPPGRPFRSSPLPTQILWTERENRLVVNESGMSRIVEIDARTGKLVSPARNFPARTFVAPAPNRKVWATIDPRLATVKLFDGDLLGSGRVADGHDATQVIAIAGNPQALVFTPDSKKVLVACDTPGPADRRVSVIDVETGSVSFRAIRGSSNLRGIAVDPQGKFALAVHLIHKSHLPSTQIEQGWVFTNAVTYLSLAGPPVAVTLPLDLRTQGFANPEGVAITPDGQKAYIAHAGADLVSVIDLPTLLDIVAASQQTAAAAGAQPATAGYVHDDLRLTRRYVRVRIPVGANPRGIAVSPDGKFVAVANRLDDSVSLIDVAADSIISTISLAGDDEQPPRANDALVRQGEKLFHSGRLSFSGQFSCASCHPDGHADGLNWDLPADGFNNFHNTKSLLSIDGTAPYGWLGMSPTLRDRFTGTLRHLFQYEPTESETAALEAYLSQLQIPGTVARPATIEPVVARGKSLFEGKAGCRACHSGPKFTDRSLHDIGTGIDGQTEFDTPALPGISTTAPYLHDGRAATLDEIFRKYNPSGLHGNAAELAPGELADLIEYLKSL